MEHSQESFILYKDSIEELLLLPIEQRGMLLTTVFCYVNGRELPQLDLATTIVWQIWKKNIDRNAEKWEETRQRRSAAGRKGGLASHNQMEVTPSNANDSQANQAVTGTVTDTVPVTATETGTVTESVPGTVVAEAPASPKLISFPLKNNAEYVISVEDAENWQMQFPTVEVKKEFSAMRDWLIAHPERQRSSEKMDDFLNYWLTNTQKRSQRKENVSYAEQAEPSRSSLFDHCGTIL
jgi:hypothetical protein